jgi:myo-inositol-1-phosphate synthase
MDRIGAWLIGASGSLASTAIVGARAIAHGLAEPAGLVTELPEVSPLPLIGLEQLVFGGWDVKSAGVLHRAREMALEDRALGGGLIAALEDDLKAVETRVRPGFAHGAGPATPSRATRPVRRQRESLRHVAERLGEDLDRFRQEHRLKRIIVVDLASMERPVPLQPEHAELEGFRRLIQKDLLSHVTPSMLYAYVALERGCPYVNFTPSIAVGLPALQELGLKRHVPFYGNDGKTGETLLKMVLTGLFRYHNLEVLSWDGFKIRGGGDRRVLAKPGRKQSRVRRGPGVPDASLGYSPHAAVSVEYVPSLGNWKTAWDHIHFRGFLGTKMSLQLIWQGCDSILAAPLVLDLVRLTDFAARMKQAGPMTHLACFFKDPLDVKIRSFADQFQLLVEYVAVHDQVAKLLREGSPGDHA